MLETSTLISVVALYLAFAFAILAFFLVRQKNREGKIKNTLHLMQRWNDPIIVSSMQKISRIEHEQIDLDNEEIAISAIHIMNFFEEVGISVNTNIVSNRITREYFSDFVVESYLLLEKIIYQIRKKYRNDVIYRNFEQLARRYSTSEGA